LTDFTNWANIRKDGRIKNEFQKEAGFTYEVTTRRLLYE
jgi:hypothetical protein